MSTFVLETGGQRETMTSNTKKRDRTAEQRNDTVSVVVLCCVIALMAGGFAGHFGYGDIVKRAAIWIGSLGLLVIVVVAVVGATSASWTAGRSVAPRLDKKAPPARPATSDAASPVVGQSPDVGALTELARLHSMGALTDAEFEAAKHRVISA